MPARLAATHSFEQFDAEDMIGSGPSCFVLDECAPGSRVAFERFDGHVPRDEPASFTAGDKVARIEGVGRVCMPDPNVVVEELDSIGMVTAMWPNFLHPPFSDVRARQALLWLTDLVPNLQTGDGDPRYFEPCAAIFMCVPCETDDGTEALRGFDFDKATTLFEEAGHDGQPIVILYPAAIPCSHAFAPILADAQQR